MCRTKMAVNASQPNSAPTPTPMRTRSTQSPPRSTHSPRTPSLPSFPAFNTTSSSEASTSSANYANTSSSLFSGRTSISSLRESLSQNPHIYHISEIRTATNNFLSKRYSSSNTPAWRSTLRNSDTIILQRKFRRKIHSAEIRTLLSTLCRSHHGSVVNLLGASISDDYIYLVYDFIKGGNLSDILRNSRNPQFTVLSSWMSRMQIATDISSALDYIHNKTGLNLTLVHNHIKSSSVIVTEPHFNAKLCHFGAAQLSGETAVEEKSEIEEVSRSESGRMQFEGVRGYMSPEFQITGDPSQESDVYAFGVVILELLSGEEPLKYKYDKSRGDFARTSVIETAREAVEEEGRLRRWMDKRLKDSYPLEVAEKLTRVALECVDVDAKKRPDMGRVAGKISRMYLSSKKWDEVMKFSDQISVSLAPR